MASTVIPRVVDMWDSQCKVDPKRSQSPLTPSYCQPCSVVDMCGVPLARSCREAKGHI